MEEKASYLYLLIIPRLYFSSYERISKLSILGQLLRILQKYTLLSLKQRQRLNRPCCPKYLNSLPFKKLEMFSKILKVVVITLSVFFTSYFIVLMASYFHYSDAMDKKLCDDLLMVFCYYAQRCLYLWSVFNFIEVMLLLVVVFVYTTFFK